ncbi:MAG: hypothetical protein MUF24_07840 [Chitinophagaceae bacterium]|jgi:hypothetical protein|nr:hypothetical protein [Chitinophagaceae bacterium]
MNNPAVDIFIGLVFIYLLYSLLASIIQEILARWLCLRARMLQKSLRRMLEDDDRSYDDYWKNSGVLSFFIAIINSIGHFFNPFEKGKGELLKKFYSHPTVKYLGEGGFNSKPSYLQPATFSQTMIQLLRGDGFDGRFDNESASIQLSLDNNTLNISEETRRQLRMLFADARGDSYLFKTKLEQWYNEMQDRTTGWYKRQNQVFLVLIGFFLACFFNVDTLAITKILLKDKGARDKLVELAINRQETYGSILDSVQVTQSFRKSSLEVQPSPKDSTRMDTTFIFRDSVIQHKPSDNYLDSVKQLLYDDANLVQGILGLNALGKEIDSSECKELSLYYDSLIAKAKGSKVKDKLKSKKEYLLSCCVQVNSRNLVEQQNDFLKFIGWLITALAISLGAPFWFDLLSKLIQIRGAGPKPSTGGSNSGVGTAPQGNNPIIDQNNQVIRG